MKNRRIKLIFHQWCELTTCNGILDWFIAKHKCGRWFWFVSVALCAFLTGLSITIVVSDYTSDNKYTTSVWVEPVTQLRFPNITVCNFNRARYPVLQELGITNDALSYAFGSLLVFYDFPLHVYGNITWYENAWRELIERNSSLADVRYLLNVTGQTCAKTFWNCVWKTQYINCCKFVTEVINSYGKCFVFSPPPDNGNSYPMQKTPGISQGLKLVLDPCVDNYPPNLVVNNFLEHGFMINAAYVYEPLLSDPIAVGPNVHAFISLDSKVERVDTPRLQVAPLPCRQDLTLQILNQPYTKQNCILDCALQFTLHHCGCVFLSDLKGDYPICNASAGYDCLGVGIEHMDTSVKVCVQQCIAPCHDFPTVSSTVSTTRFQMSTLSRAVGSILDEMGVPALSNDSQPTILDIYFPLLELTYVETSESTSVFTFMSNIGGQLGLWLGLSFGTFVQMFYYVYICLAEHKAAGSATRIKK